MDRIVETHTARLYFDDGLVFKVKRPVRFPFVDLSTRELRRGACIREVALNRRLAPDVYLGVQDVTYGGPPEPAVVMRRMPDDRRLSSLLDTPGAYAHIEHIARAMASFHARAPVPGPEVRAGTAPTVRHAWIENAREMEGYVPRYMDRATFDDVRELAERYVAGRVKLFDLRLAHGKVRDGHGDLLADDIFCMDDGPRILDCLEFDDRLRCGDVLEDMAFLAMDLERLGHPRLARALLARYREFSADTYPESLARHYIAYRAHVRAKIACIRADAGEADAPAEAASLLAMARAHLSDARVRLVLIGGLPGTGKSTAAARLSEEREWAVLRSDVVRKDMMGIPPERGVRAPFGTGIYRPEITDATYRELLSRARPLLELGETVILDASWVAERHREQARALAYDTASDLIEVRFDAPTDVAAERMRSRTMDASDATPEIAAQMAVAAEPWTAAASVDASGPIERTLERARAVLDRAPAHAAG